MEKNTEKKINGKSVSIVSAIAVLWMCPAVRGVDAPAVPAFTNHAGHAVVGRPVAVDAGDVTLERADGSRINVPLSAFPWSEQARIRKAAGLPEPKTKRSASGQRSRADFIRRMRLRRAALKRTEKSQ